MLKAEEDDQAKDPADRNNLESIYLFSVQGKSWNTGKRQGSINPRFLAIWLTLL